MTVFPSMPRTLLSASAIASPGTANTTASASETSPPSRPILLTSCPAPSQRSASPPPTLPLPTTAIFTSGPFRSPCAHHPSKRTSSHRYEKRYDRRSSYFVANFRELRLGEVPRILLASRSHCI